jgi:Transmembrane protein 138
VNAPHLLLGLLGLQIVIEISVFLILFLAMADTFLFRVGLLGLLVKKFRSVLIFHPIYVALTLACGLYRVNRFSSGEVLSVIWRDQKFVGLSCIQKIVAIPYYVLNIRATIKLGDPVYFDKDAWIALFKQERRNREVAQRRM